MAEIKLKTANRKTSISREEVRRAISSATKEKEHSAQLKDSANNTSHKTTSKKSSFNKK